MLIQFRHYLQYGMFILCGIRYWTYQPHLLYFINDALFPELNIL